MSPLVVDREKRRKQILDAAASVFSKKGFGSARMEDIAVKAGISKGLVYEYFKNKDELFFALYDHVSQQFYELIFRNIEKEKTVEAALKKMIQATFDALDEWEEFGHIFLDFWAEHRRARAMQVRFSELYSRDRARLAEFIEAGIRKGEFRKMDPIASAAIIIALLDGLMLQRIFDKRIVKKYDIDKHAEDMIFKGILKGKTGRVSK